MSNNYADKLQADNLELRAEVERLNRALKEQDKTSAHKTAAVSAPPVSTVDSRLAALDARVAALETWKIERIARDAGRPLDKRCLRHGFNSCDCNAIMPEARVAALEKACHCSAEAGDERMDRIDDRVAALENLDKDIVYGDWDRPVGAQPKVEPAR